MLLNFVITYQYLNTVASFFCVCFSVFPPFSYLPIYIYRPVSIDITIYLYLYRRRQWHPTPVLLPGKSHGRRSLVGCSPWGRQEANTTERLHFHFSLSSIGEGNGNPLPVFLPGESQGRGSLMGCRLWGRTESARLKRLSSSSSSYYCYSDFCSIRCP